MDARTDEDKIHQQSVRIMKELQEWPEDRVKQILRQRLEDDSWIVSPFPTVLRVERLWRRSKAREL